MKKNSSVLVTGSRGFVGRHLCKHLMRIGHEVVGVSLDVTKLTQLLAIKKGVDLIIHLAAKTSINNSMLSPYETYNTNVLGTLNLLEFARQRKVSKFINISTYVYGKPQYLPIDERHPVDPHSPYTKSKLVAEKLCQFYSQDFDMDIVTLRPFYLYGPCTRSNSFIQVILEQIMSKKGTVTLSAEQTKRDFLFIDDFINLIERVLEKFPAGYNVYNVGYGKSYTLAEVSQILAKLLRRKLRIKYDTKLRPEDVVEMVADVSRISKEFSWKPSIGLQQGLELTVKHCLELQTLQGRTTQ